MFDDVPVRVWLMIAIAVYAYPPAQYAVRHIANSPSRHDITQAPPDLSWRSSEQFTRSLIILGLLAALAIFIFTPVAADFAGSPIFLPLLFVAGGGWALSTVVRGVMSGSIAPLVRGIRNTYEREAHPKRFWASLIWNAAVGSLLLGTAYPAFNQAMFQADWDQCFDAYSTTAGSSRSACGALTTVYDENIRRDEQDYGSRYDRGRVHGQLGDMPQALEDFSAAIRLRPDDPDAYFSRGRILSETRKFDEAISDFSRAHELDPEDAWPLANRGIAYAWKQDQVRAEKDFAAAAAIDPANVVVMRGRGLLRMQEADLPGAVAYLSASLKREPDSIWALRMRAWNYRQMGESEKAQADEDKLLRLIQRETAAFQTKN